MISRSTDYVEYCRRTATELHNLQDLALRGRNKETITRLGFDVRKGLSHELPLPDACASVVVCNNVLLIVPRQNIPATLREICRIARPGARVFLGEIPFVPGPPPEPQFETAQETLSYLYRQYGLRTWFGMARRMAYWKLTGQPIVLHDGRVVSFFARPEEFIALAQAAGLELVRYWRHEYPNTRNNYLFRKPAGVSSMN